MKKTILAILTAAVTVASSQAQIFYDAFNYSTGTLAPSTTTPSNGSWLALNSGTAPAVVSGNLDISGLQSSTGNSVSWTTGNIQEAYTTFSSASTGLLYYSFAFRLTALPTATTYSFGLMQPGSTTTYGSTIWLRASGAGFNVGLDNRTPSSTSNFAAPTYNLNETLFIVGSYEFVSGTGNDISRIWINPSSTDFSALSAPTATITATGGTDLTGVRGFLLRGANGSPSGQMDELRIGTSWADVTPVPEPSSSMLMVLGAGALVGIRSLRRKQS